jgi:hypothetical protein
MFTATNAIFSSSTTTGPETFLGFSSSANTCAGAATRQRWRPDARLL